MVEVKRIEENLTQLKISNKHNEFFIKQLKFIGAVPVKESSRYTYFNEMKRLNNKESFTCKKLNSLMEAKKMKSEDVVKIINKKSSDKVKRICSLTIDREEKIMHCDKDGLHEKNKTDNAGALFSWSDEVEVIGNIYDNPIQYEEQ